MESIYLNQLTPQIKFYINTNQQSMNKQFNFKCLLMMMMKNRTMNNKNHKLIITESFNKGEIAIAIGRLQNYL